MPEFDIVFEKLQLALAQDDQEQSVEISLVPNELDEIDELRRYAAEIREPEPFFYTIT